MRAITRVRTTWTLSSRPAQVLSCAARKESLPRSPVELTEELQALLRGRSTCYLATSMADGSPQVTQTWVDTDGEHVLINSVRGYVKLQNIERDPRVAVAISDPTNPTAYKQVRGHVVTATTDGAAEHIEILSEKYLGRPYPWFGGRDQVRVKLVIEADSFSGMG